MATDNHDRDEEALVDGLIRGDTEHIKDFLRRCHRPVYAMTARLTLDPDLRHDWCQDILLKIIKEMGTGRFVYQRPGCFWAWFKARTNFLLINHYQQDKKHNQRWSAGEIGEDLVEKMPLDPGTDPLRILETVDARRIVEDCLENLPSEDHRRALHLLLFQDQTYQEVADSMGATMNTVRSWIRRARLAMRQCVAGKYDGVDLE